MKINHKHFIFGMMCLSSSLAFSKKAVECFDIKTDEGRVHGCEYDDGTEDVVVDVTSVKKREFVPKNVKKEKEKEKEKRKNK